MKFITRIRIFFKRLKYTRKKLEKTVFALPIQEVEILQDKTENEGLIDIANREKFEIINVSEKLKKYINKYILYEKNINREIRKCDIKEIINLIKKRNEVRVNTLRINADIADELFVILENNLEENMSLGEVEIDISNKGFKIKKFIESHNKISCILKFKILSLEDLRTEEFDFLHSRYGIIYIYANEEYYLDELLETIQKLEKFIPKENKNDLETAKKILKIISNTFELYEPKSYEMKKKSVFLVNGETLKLPNFKVVENTSNYSSIRNIFSSRKANEIGLKRICKETLKLAKFNVIETIESFTNTIKRYDLVIDNIKYRIEIKSNKIELVK